MTTTGIIFATEREAEPLLRATGAEKLSDGTFPAWRFSANGNAAIVIACGMGKAAAARGAEYLLATHNAAAIVNAGICGCVGGAAQVGEVFWVDETRDADLPDAAAHRCEAGRWNHLPAARLVSCDSPVFDPQRRQQLSGRGEKTGEKTGKTGGKTGDSHRKTGDSHLFSKTGDSHLFSEPFWCSFPNTDSAAFDEQENRCVSLVFLVDMEGYAVAGICARRSVPCCLIKGVSDMAGDGGREVMLKNIDAVSDAVADALLQGLTATASAAETARRRGQAADADGLFAKLMRFTKIEHTVFSLPLVFAGAWLGAGRRVPPLAVLGLIVAASVGARVLGMSMNRILDRKLDAQNPRTARRELPAGRLSARTAGLVALAGGLVYVLACVMLGPAVAMLSPVPLAVLMGYSLLKRFTPLCHFGIGLCLGLAPLAASVAASGRLDPTPAVLLLSLYAFCWMSGFDIIYSLQDIDADRRTGVHSIPAALGARRGQAVAMCVHAVAIAAGAGMVRMMNGGIGSFAALAIAAGAFVAAYLPIVPLPARFFPISAIAGIAGALVPLLARG